MGKARAKSQGVVICLLLMASVTVAYEVEFDDDIWLMGDESVVRWYNGIYYISFGASDSLAANYSFIGPLNDGESYQFLQTDGSGVLSWSTSFASISLLEQSSNPDAPIDGKAVIWLSDGSGYGDAGDVMIASKTGSVTRYGTLFDFSGGTLWEADTMIYENSDVMLLESGDTMVYE